MTKALFVFLVLVLFFTCLCLGSNHSGDETSTTVQGDESTTLPEDLTSTTVFTETTEEVTTTFTYDSIPDTTWWWSGDDSTSTFPEDVTTTTLSSNATVPLKANGVKCLIDSECVSGRCGGVCCMVGQCIYNGKCYSSGQSRPEDKAVCRGNSSWSKVLTSKCAEDNDCLTGYCKNNFCCNREQCGFGGIGTKYCYSVGEARFDNKMSCAKVFGNYTKITILGNGSEQRETIQTYYYDWRKANGQSCGENSDCTSNSCNNGYCCLASQCAYKGVCLNVGGTTFDGLWICTRNESSNVLSLKKRNKQSCSSDEDCGSGNCDTGFCCKVGQCGYANDCYDVGDKTTLGNCTKSGWKK